MKRENPYEEENLKESHREEMTELKIVRDNPNVSRSILAKEMKRWHYIGLIFILGLSSFAILKLLCAG